MNKQGSTKVNCSAGPAFTVQAGSARDRERFPGTHASVQACCSSSRNSSDDDSRSIAPFPHFNLAAIPANSEGQEPVLTLSKRNRSPNESFFFKEGRRLPFSASIRIDRSHQPSRASEMIRMALQNDGTPGSQPPAAIDFTSLAPVSAAPLPSAELNEGQTVQLPDISIPAMAAIAQRDPVNSTLKYNGTITQDGSLPTPFGETKPYTHALSGPSVTRSAGNFVVTATVDNPITFQVNGGSDTDIASETDPAITQANYSTVVSDLTPDMSDENGRPPRTQFWARDLTIRHERFHAQEDFNLGGRGTTAAQTWLNGQAAADVAGVNTLLRQVPGRVANTVAAGMTFPGLEERAYGDGAASYRARAAAIKRRGDANGYPGLSRGSRAAIGLGVGAGVGALIGVAAGGGVGAAVGAGVGATVGLIGGLAL